MPGMAAIAMGAAPVLGGALFGAAVGQLRGPNLREGIKQDLELLDQMPEVETARREALRRSIDDRIDELITAEDTARQPRAAASSYQGSWRDIVLFLCRVLFSVVWWSVDHDLLAFDALQDAGGVEQAVGLRDKQRPLVVVEQAQEPAPPSGVHENRGRRQEAAGVDELNAAGDDGDAGTPA